MGRGGALMLSSPECLFPEASSVIHLLLTALTRCGKIEKCTTEARGTFDPQVTQLTWLLFSFHGIFRAISTARLNVSPRLHLRPIDVVVSDGPQ